MKILDLKEGDGIRFDSRDDQDRIIPALLLFGYSELSGNSIKAASRLTRTRLYVSIEKDKKLVYTSSPNFRTIYVPADQVQTPLKPFCDLDGAAKFHTGGFVFEPSTKVEYPLYFYDIAPADGLALIRMLNPEFRQAFKDMWGDSILDGKNIVSTEHTKQNYLAKCLTKHRDAANKLFKIQCPYADDELVLVKNGCGPWTPRFFYKMDSDDSVWVHGHTDSSPSKFKYHCKAKVTPA